MKRWLFCSLVLGACASFGDVTARSYVSAGLIAHWDGRVSSGGTAEWVDLIGGRSIALTGVTRAGHGLDFAGTKSSYGFLPLAESKEIFEGHTKLTVELAVKFPAAGSKGVILKSTAASGVAAEFFDSNRYSLCGASATRRQGAAYGSAQATLTATYSSAKVQNGYFNGTLLSTSSIGVSTPGDFGGTYVGQLGDGTTPFKGRIYAIRVYDRLLTAAEIAQNAAVDAAWLYASDPDEYLFVTGEPGIHGTPSPNYGPVQGLSVGSEISLTAPADQLADGTNMHFQCTGWTFDGTNGVHRGGMDTSLTLTLPCSGVFRWQFAVENLVTVQPASGGTVSPTNAWVSYDEPLTLTATPDEGNSFFQWKGEVPSDAKGSNPLTLKVRRPADLTPWFLYGSPDSAAVPDYTVRAFGTSTAEPLDLSSLWLPTNRAAIAVAYSSVGWDLDDASVPNSTVDLELVQTGVVGKAVLVSGLTGRGTFAWTPETVERAGYDLTHLVRVSGVSDVVQALTAHFSFANLMNEKASEAEIWAAIRGDVSQPFAFVNNGGDEDVRWEPVAGAGEGLVAPYADSGSAETSALEFQVSGAGTFAFAVRLDGGSLAILVDGVLRETVSSAADWAEKSVEIEARGAHVIRLEATVSAAQAAFVKGARWLQEDLSFGSATGAPAPVDLREGIRIVNRPADLLPFVWSSTNFTGLAGATDASVARVSVVRLAPLEPTDDLAAWTNEVAGTERVLRRQAGEGSVVWRGTAGVWKAVFDILNGENAIHTETAVFDMREFIAGFMLLLK